MFREVLEVLSERRGPGSLEGSEREINKRLPLTQNLKNPQNPSNLTPSQNLKNPQNPSNLTLPPPGSGSKSGAAAQT